MSTTVDIGASKKPRRPRSSADETRARVIASARLAFCEAGFDHVGMREIAARASTDPAIVIRLFGSKEGLFEEVANSAFDLEPVFHSPRAALGRQIAAFLLAPEKALAVPDDFDAFHFLLRSAASPVAAPILSASLHASFVLPLARQLGPDMAEGRAALLTSCVLGLTTMRFALKSPSLQADQAKALYHPFAAALQACIDG